MSFLAWQQPWRRSAQPPVAENSLREILQAGLQHPAGSLERRRSLSHLMLTMQASGQIEVGHDDTGAEALLATWFQLCQSPERYLQASDLVEQFNQDVRQRQSN